MKIHHYFCLAGVILLSLVRLSAAEEFVLSGSQQSAINYRLMQEIEPFPDIEELTVFFVAPQNFTSPTYRQEISNLSIKFSLPPVSEETYRDDRGDTIKKYHWKSPQKAITCEVSFSAVNRVSLEPREIGSLFPLTGIIPAEAEVHLKATELVQSDNSEILQKAKELTRSSTNQYEAVMAILRYEVDNMRYVLMPEKYDALYSFRQKKGNCQNYSHLAAALLRSVGIPVRIVNGITLKKACSIEAGEYSYSFEMAQGRHSWIEVYFPDFGWIPFDPQQTAFFIHNRYIRLESGLDNNETGNDALIQWTQSAGSETQYPKVGEAFEAVFKKDEVALDVVARKNQPKNLILTPEIKMPALAAATVKEPEAMVKEPLPQTVEPVIEPVEEVKLPEKKAEIDYASLTYDQPFEFGNLEFPLRFNFLKAKLSTAEKSAEGGRMKSNFIVETAEYVTTSREQFAQIFIMEEPIILKDISLALYNFGSEGNIWLEIYEDLNGKPGKAVAQSGKILTRGIRTPEGYDWVKFDFSRQGIGLTPDRYWLILRYAGSPIINWFYSYGKPVGPTDGTRSCPIEKESWNRVLPFEFNYKITGLGAKAN